MRHALVTGGAGFIGSHLVDALLADGWRVTVMDTWLGFDGPHLKYIRGDIRFWPTDCGEVDRGGPYDVIVHLAARAGVRPSIEDPVGYHETNALGTQHVLEFARDAGIKQVVFASSSSVYGNNPWLPWRENDFDLRPLSPYAASKIAGEMLGRVYSHLHAIRFLALRFFTVYGPRQRPDLAIRTFATRILAGQPVTVFGSTRARGGGTQRDYTYIDDVVRGIRSAMDYRESPFEVFNIGSGRAVSIGEMIAELERALGVSAVIERSPEQPGDAPFTCADINKAHKLLGYEPSVSFPDGVKAFAEWLLAQSHDEAAGDPW